MSSDQLTMDFIEDYRLRSVLWDTSDKLYTNKLKRNEAYAALAEKFQMSVQGVKTKIKNLRSYFCKEQQKMSAKKSAGEEEDYESPWFAFKSLEFLGDTYNSRCTATYLEEDMMEGQYAITNLEALEHLGTVEETTDGGIEKGTQERMVTPLRNRRNLKRKFKKDHDKTKEERAYAFLDAAAKEFVNNKDDNTVFGQLVASQLRKLSARNQAIAKNRIQNTLFELEIEEFDTLHQ